MRAYHPCPPAVMQLKQTPGYECLADRTSERDDIHNRCILLREISTADCILYLYTPRQRRATHQTLPQSGRRSK